LAGWDKDCENDVFSAITSALILSGRLLLPGVVWTTGQPARSWLDRAGRIAVTGLLLNLLPALLLGAAGRWTLPLDWLAWALVTAGGAWWNRSRFLGWRHSGIRLAGAAALIVAVVTVPMLLPVRSEWLAGGWDPGMYQNNAVAIAHRNGLIPKTDSVYTPLSFADRLLLSDASETPYHEIMPAVPIRLRDGALPLYFPPLTPVCGAWLYRIGGMAMLVRLPAILAFLGLLPFMSFIGMIGLTRIQRWAALGFLIISPVWWYHQAVPTSEMLSLFLLYGGLVFYMQSMEDRRRIPGAAMLVLFAATVNHFSVPVFAGILLLLAAAVESSTDRPCRQWRLASCFGALLAGLCFGLHSSWMTLARLQEKDAALSIILTVVLVSGVIACLLALRSRLRLLSLSRHVLTGSSLQALVMGLLILTALLSVGKSRTVMLTLFASVPFAGTFLHHYSRFLAIHGSAWFMLALVGTWVLLRERKDGLPSAAGLLVPALGMIFALLLGSSGITPIYPWALRRTMIVAIPFMAITQACAASRVVGRGTMHPVWRVLLGVLVALSLFGGLKVGRHAAQVGDYAGLSTVLEELNGQLQQGDVVIADDARWGTPFLLLYNRDVLNGERLLRSGGDDAFLDVVRRIQARHHGRILWLTSSDAGLGVYPVLHDYTEAVTRRIPFEYRTVIHSAHERRFRMESRRAVFQLHEQMEGSRGPLTITRPGPHRLLADGPDDNPDGAMVLQWGGRGNHEIRRQGGWQWIDLPAPVAGASPELQWTWSPGQGRPPQFLLYAPGDALLLTWWQGHLYPEGTRTPGREAAGGGAAVFPLPFFPGAAAIRVTLSAAAPLPSLPVTARVRIDDGEVRELVLDRGQPTSSVTFPGGDARLVSADASGIADGLRLNLRLQPLYAVLDCIPARTGTYVFRAGVDSGATVARSLAGGVPGKVEGDGGLIGECVYVHPAGAWHRSNLDDDALIRFRRFHPREDTGDPLRPYQRWTSSGEAGIQITAPPDAGVRMRIRLRDVRPPSLASHPASLHVGTDVHPVVFSNSAWSASVFIPAGEQRDEDRNSISIRIQSDTWSPASAMSSGDDRVLGMLVDELMLYYSYEGSAEQSDSQAGSW